MNSWPVIFGVAASLVEMLQPLLLAQDLEGVLCIMQDPRRALHEAVTASSASAGAAPEQEQKQEQQSVSTPSPHGGRQQLERQGSLGGFLLLRRPSAIAEGGKAAGAVAGAYNLPPEEGEEGAGDEGGVVYG